MTRSTSVRFVDTNVLLYAISRDPEEQDKAERANRILGAMDLALSVQVLQEFYVPRRHRLAAASSVRIKRTTVRIKRTTSNCFRKLERAWSESAMVRLLDVLLIHR